MMGNLFVMCFISVESAHKRVPRAGFGGLCNGCKFKTVANNTVDLGNPIVSEAALRSVAADRHPIPQ